MAKNIERTAKILKELGHPVRLSILEILLKEGKKGLAVGKLQEQLNIPNSTLSHHISCMKNADILIQSREGRTLYCSVNYSEIHSVTNFFIEDCCINEEK